MKSRNVSLDIIQKFEDEKVCRVSVGLYVYAYAQALRGQCQVDPSVVTHCMAYIRN